MRKENDLLGEKLVPSEAYYGIQTLRALEVGSISNIKLNNYPDVIQTLAQVKKACALANLSIQALPFNVGHAIIQACDEIISGQYFEQFVVDMYSGGGAIAINMNMNEVLANRANEILTGNKGYDVVHPNTHVNMCQSTNDVIPSAMKITLFKKVHSLLDSIIMVEDSFERKSVEFKDAVKLSRTCLQDALPITFGQEFSGYSQGIKRQRERLQQVMKGWLHLSLGATAVGTGMGIMPGYIEAVYNFMQRDIHPKIQEAANMFDSMQNADDYLYLSGTLKCLAVILGKIAYDLKIMSSGPHAGLAEIKLPPVQPGSSIMPGKVNPALPEMISQVCQQVCGNDLTITMAVEKGELDLNIFEQILLKNILDSCTLLENALPIFASRCIDGIEVNVEKAFSDAENSPALVTIVSTLLGYKTGLAIISNAQKEQCSIKQAAINSGLFSEEQANELFDPLVLSHREKILSLMSKYAHLRAIN